MKIKEITFELGNDFEAILECEHCNNEQKLESGYHDTFYHTQVIPNISCFSCNKNRAGEKSKATARTPVKGGQQ